MKATDIFYDQYNEFKAQVYVTTTKMLGRPPEGEFMTGI